MGCLWKLCLFSTEEVPTKIKENRISTQRIQTVMVKNGSQMGEEQLFLLKYFLTIFFCSYLFPEDHIFFNCKVLK